MKKLLTKKQQQKRDQRNQLIVGILLISLMLFSTLGYALGGKGTEDKNSKVEYKDIIFTKTSGYWSFNYQGTNFNTLYNPTELQDIPILTQTTLQSYSQLPLYFVGGGEGIYEILGVFNGYLERYQEACLDDNSSCKEELPIKDCTNNLIIFQEGENKVYKEENCVFIQGDPVRVSDAFLYKIIGI